MTLEVTNTLTGEKEPFEPRDPDDVCLYLCGLTVSDRAHLGHARTWVHTDAIHRWLEHEGYGVRHVENFTDVNEKIVARVGEDGDSEADVARSYITDTIADMRSLNLLRADVYPRVSEHVPEIIDLIETLVEKEYAYEADSSVYFDVTAFEDYGTLSNQAVDEMEAQDDGHGEKRHPADFALWKAGGVSADEVDEHRHEGAAPAAEAAATAETWSSPWGEGRPGWHIECSAMSTTHLDDTIDMHVAGQDLVFPHNENEIAQAEAATGEQFSRYWLHVRLLETEGEKMSSSLRNYFTVENAVETFGTDAVRMFLLSTAYDSRQTYSEAAIDEAVERWERLERAYERAVEAADSVAARTKVADDTLREAIEAARTDFAAAMNDDFNTRAASSALLELASAVNSHTDEREEYDYRALHDAIDVFEDLAGDVLGFTFGQERESDVGVAGDLVEMLLNVREQERADGNYDRADALRDELESLGVEVQDTDEGPTYRL